MKTTPTSTYLSKLITPHHTMQFSLTLLATLALPLLTHSTPVTGDGAISNGATAASVVGAALTGPKPLPCAAGNDTCACSYAER